MAFVGRRRQGTSTSRGNAVVSFTAATAAENRSVPEGDFELLLAPDRVCGLFRRVLAPGHLSGLTTVNVELSLSQLFFISLERKAPVESKQTLSNHSDCDKHLVVFMGTSCNHRLDSVGPRWSAFVGNKP